ncbi:MAG: peptidylprolyl isomerase [Caulobacteraceae bacterium]|nr:peptidylprolyl isomerase [Caulobacteraceae bacterium]
MKPYLTAAALALTLAAAGGAALAQAAPDWRPLDLENTLVIDTSKGRIVVELSPATAPQNVERIKTLTRQHFYDGIVFHRVIADFMAQTGDPQGTGQGGSTLPDVPGEFAFRRNGDMAYGAVTDSGGQSTGYLNALPVVTSTDDMMMFTADQAVPGWGAFCPGVMGMARQGEPNTANSQFYIMRGTERALDHLYTPLGYVVQGLDVVYKLNLGEPPRQPDKMITVRIAADLPPAEQPRLQVMDPRGGAFRAMVDKLKKDEGPAFDICSVKLAARAAQ